MGSEDMSTNYRQHSESAIEAWTPAPGFTSLSLCDKAMFDECQDGKLTTLTKPWTKQTKVPLRMKLLSCTETVNISPSGCSMPPPARALSNEFASSGASSPNEEGSEVSASWQEMKCINAAGSIFKNPMHPSSSFAFASHRPHLSS